MLETSQLADPNEAVTASEIMACYHPLTAWAISSPGGEREIVFKSPNERRITGRIEQIELPCGQCSGCRLERSRQWAIRCHHEASLHQENSFVTLTYRDSDLPAGGTLDKEHLRNFLKRLRTNTIRDGHRKQADRIRFYGCGEYGDKLHRPHYHVCFFGYRPHDLRPHTKNHQGEILFSSKYLDKQWKHGYTITGEVTFKSAAYVARYIMKKINGPDATTHYENVSLETGEITTVIPEFTTMSKNPGIGKEWFDRYYKSDVQNTDTVVINDKKMRVPRYYDRLLEKIDPHVLDDIQHDRLSAASRHADNNTPERLLVRETVHERKLEQLKRSYE